MKNSDRSGGCMLCDRVVPLTFHHLIPKKVHRRKHYRKHFLKEQLQSGIFICRACHKAIHALYDEMTLAKQLSSLEALQADRALIKHVHWVRKQKA